MEVYKWAFIFLNKNQQIWTYVLNRLLLLY